MFLTGETSERVFNGKLRLPREFHLQKKDLFCKWKNEDTLILSDSLGSLDYMAGRDKLSGKMHIGADSTIDVSKDYEGSLASIRGCVTTLEIQFSR